MDRHRQDGLNGVATALARLSIELEQLRIGGKQWQIQLTDHGAADALRAAASGASLDFVAPGGNRLPPGIAARIAGVDLLDPPNPRVRIVNPLVLGFVREEIGRIAGDIEKVHELAKAL